MLEFEALADTIGYLAVGDMVLSAIASTFLGRWGVPFADDNPWPDFMTEVDARILHGDEPYSGRPESLISTFGRLGIGLPPIGVGLTPKYSVGVLRTS